MALLQTSNQGDSVLLAASAPFLRSPSPTPEPAKLSPSLKQPSSKQLQAVQQAAQVRRASPKKKPVSSSRPQAPVVGSKRSVTDSLVVEDDSKPHYRDIGSVAGLPWETVVLRPPFSLF